MSDEQTGTENLGTRGQEEELAERYTQALREGISGLTDILAQAIQDTPSEWVLPKGVKALYGKDRLHQIKYYLE